MGKQRILIQDVLLLDPEQPEPARGAILIEAGHIAACFVGAPPAGIEGVRRLSRSGLALTPGFIDLHIHGHSIFAAAADLGTALASDVASSLRHGTTGMLTTTVAWEPERLLGFVRALALAAQELGENRDALLGLHLEGPWINPGAVGAQPATGHRRPDPEEFRRLSQAAGGKLRMLTLAPELEGAGPLLDQARQECVIVALGHSLASASCIDAAIKRGLTHVTHLFNAMGAIHHRDPGVAGSVLSDDRLSCDLICDGVHVAPAMVRLAARAKGGRLILITDRIQPPAPEAAASFGAGSVAEEGGALRLADGRLAGSKLSMNRALANASAFGAMTRLEAVAACTLRPARLLGLESQRGTLRPGARADLALLGPDGAVVETWLAGRPVFQADT